MVKKLNFVKENKTIVRSSHPLLDTFIINYKGTEIKVAPIKIVEIIDANAPISTKTKKIIEQNNFVNNSLHIIGQQLDQIEEKIEKPTSSKTEKPLIDLPSQRQILSLKTTKKKKKKKPSRILLLVLLNLFQEKGKRLVFLKIPDSDSSSFASNKFVFNMPEIKRFVEKSNPMSLTKYS